MFAIGVQKDSNFLQNSGLGKILCNFSYYSTEYHIHKRKTKVFHHEMERAHTGLHLAGKCTHIITICWYCGLPDAILCSLPKSSRVFQGLQKDHALVSCPEGEVLLLFFFFKFNIVFGFCCCLVTMWKIPEHMGISNLSWYNLWSQDGFLIQMEARRVTKDHCNQAFVSKQGTETSVLCWPRHS